MRATVTHPRPGAARLHLAGELDVTSEPLLRELAERLPGERTAVVELDAGGVDFVDLRGLRSLGTLGTRVAQQAAVTVTRSSPALDRVVAAWASVALDGVPCRPVLGPHGASKGCGPPGVAGARCRSHLR